MKQDSRQKYYESKLNLLTKEIEDDGGVSTFTLNQPFTVTIKKRNGNYSKRAMIGDETFGLSSCYMGKRNDLIFAFTPKQAVDYAFMEMKADDCREYLDDFAKWMDDKFEENIDDAIKEARQAAERKEREEYVRQREQMYDGEFGSW